MQLEEPVTVPGFYSHCPLPFTVSFSIVAPLITPNSATLCEPVTVSPLIVCPFIPGLCMLRMQLYGSTTEVFIDAM